MKAEKTRQPIETKIGDVTYRSRSEAMFATLLQERCLSTAWLYEPPQFSIDKWRWDFVVPVATDNRQDHHWCFIEYKPARPTAEYLSKLAERCDRMLGSIDADLFYWQPCCLWIDWYRLRNNEWDWADSSSVPFGLFCHSLYSGSFRFIDKGPRALLTFWIWDTDLREQDLKVISRGRFDLEKPYI